MTTYFSKQQKRIIKVKKSTREYTACFYNTHYKLTKRILLKKVFKKFDNYVYSIQIISYRVNFKF